jgi:hypothetical protein
MMRSALHATRVVGALACALAVAPASAQSVAGAWYASARSGITMTDQNFRNDGRHDAFAVGRAFARDYALELEVTRETLDFDIDYGLVNESVALNLVTVNREPLWDPYFLAGIGAQRFEGPEGLPRRTGSDLMFNLGIGGQWELIVPERVFLRADLRLRYVLDDDRQPGQAGLGDGVFTIGLSVPFGR